MKAKPGLLSAAAVIAALATPVIAQQGGGHGRPPSTETTMNLSYPALFYGTSQQSGTEGAYALGAAYPTGMSYGCDVPETIGTTTFPNTSCVTDTGTPLDPATCTAVGGKCDGHTAAELERIYWQKNASNTWQAGYIVSTAPLPVHYVDWGDNLEGRTWPVQVLRVETNTFTALAADQAKTRFENWHVFGSGTNELWGVHATNPETGSPLAYVFPTVATDTQPVSTFAVNYASTVRLNISKLHYGSAVCPATATGASQSPYDPVWDEETGTWVGTWQFYNGTYGAELNIKGSYVYGYNWNLRSAVVPGDVDKGGWWRLTFYTPRIVNPVDGSHVHPVDFSTWADPATAGFNTLAPPTWVPATAAATPSVTAAASVMSVHHPVKSSWAEAWSGTSPSLVEIQEETGLLLYVPQVDATNQLTYLDICITGGKAGGKGSR